MQVQISSAPPSCCDYVNPCSDRFTKYSFCKLSCCEKVKIIVATAFSAILGFGFGGIAVFRHCVRKKNHEKKLQRYQLTRVVPKSPRKVEGEKKVPDAPRASDRPNITIAIESPKQ